MNTTALLLALAVVAQDPEPVRSDPPPHDFVVGVAGNKIVLRTDLDLEIISDPVLEARFQGAATPDERAKVQFEALSQRLETLVRVQAGEDLGFDPELVRDLTNRAFEQRIESMGGHRAASERMARSNINPEQYRNQIRDQLLAESWRYSRIGRAQGPTGRYAVDRVIRPGLMRMYYESFIDSSVRSEREAVGRRDPAVRLQLLQVRVPSGTDGEVARAQMGLFLEAYRTQAASFDYLVDTYGDESFREERGLLREAPIRTFVALGEERHGGPELGDLAAEGEVGDTTEPLLLETPATDGQVQGQALCVYRLAERIPATPALPFESRELQAGLSAYLRGIQDDERDDAAFLGALRDTHIWPEDRRAVILETRAQKRRR